MCKRWQAVGYSSWRNFRKIDLTPEGWGFKTSEASGGRAEVNTPVLRKVLLRCGSSLTHIDFSMNIHKLSKSTLTVVGRLCPNLQSIDVTALNVSPAGIKSLMNNCTHITEFSLGSTTSACDKDLGNLFLKNQKLKILKLDSSFFTGKCLAHLPRELIQKIDLRNCAYISSSCFQNVSRTHLFI